MVSIDSYVRNCLAYVSIGIFKNKIKYILRQHSIDTVLTLCNAKRSIQLETGIVAITDGHHGHWWVKNKCFSYHANQIMKFRTAWFEICYLRLKWAAVDIKGLKPTCFISFLFWHHGLTSKCVFILRCYGIFLYTSIMFVCMFSRIDLIFVVTSGPCSVCDAVWYNIGLHGRIMTIVSNSIGIWVSIL